MKIGRLKQLREELNAHGQMSASAAELFEILDFAIGINQDDDADVALLVRLPEEASVPAKKPTKRTKASEE